MYPFVRIVLKALLVVTAFAVVVVSVCLCWFYFYSGDLPNFSALAKFAPDSPATVAYQCSNRPVQVIPSTLVSKNLQNATRAAENKNDEVLARQISFDLFCDSQTRILKGSGKTAMKLVTRATGESRFLHCTGPLLLDIDIKVERLKIRFLQTD